MANLRPLIRVRKHAIEQKQKHLADLYRQAEEQAAERKRLAEEFAHESRTIKEMGADMLSFFGAYAKAVDRRMEEIEAEITRLESRILVAQDDMRQAYADLRRIEIVQENRDRQEEEERQKKEAQELDEIGVTRFLTFQEEEA